MFLIEDDMHAEQQGEFASFEEALEEVWALARIPWDRPPNRPPCGSPTCGRDYNIIEFERDPWRLVRRVEICSITASGVTWRELRFEPSD